MIPHAGRVSMLIQFRPTEARAAARWLSTFLRPTPVVVTCASGGHVELSNVRGTDLPALTDQLYRHGARCVFVRYAHEGKRLFTDDAVRGGTARGGAPDWN